MHLNCSTNGIYLSRFDEYAAHDSATTTVANGLQYEL